jgi:hypothetical protein
MVRILLDLRQFIQIMPIIILILYEIFLDNNLIESNFKFFKVYNKESKNLMQNISFSFINYKYKEKKEVILI